MAKQNYDDDEGVWRTVNGRRFFKDSEDLSDPMKKSVKYNNKRYKDVTKEYLEEATPNRGNIDREKSYNEERHKGEVGIAEIIHKELGGDILLINEDLSCENRKSPDYKWNDEAWDLKSPLSIKPFTKRIRKGIHQIENNPGGIIVDLPKNISLNEAIDVIWKRWKTTGKKKMTSLDVIFIQNKKIIRILRFS